jgi:type I restriction enzyme S subunit
VFLIEEEFVTNSESKNFSQNVSSSYHLKDRGKCNKNTCAITRNIPKLRFKGYNDELITIKLNKLFSKVKEKNNKGNITNVICNSAKFGLLPQREYFDKDIANIDNTLGYYVIKNNDFVYNPRKSKDAPYGPLCIYEYSEIGIVSPLYLVFRKTMDIDTNFFKYYFLSTAWHRYVYLEGDSGARHDRVSIKDTTFFDMPVKIPFLEEQEKISSFLTLIDRKIEKQKELVELLKKYKRGLLFSLFSQKLRFKDEKGRDYPNWKEKRLEEILKIKHGKSQKEIECKNGKYPILATGGEIGKTNKYLWDKPCVLIGRKGTIDKPQYLDTPFWTVDTLFYSEVFKDNNAKYLYYLFNTINWKKYDESTGVPSLSAKTIERIKVTLSINYSEQLTISKILSNFNYKIQQEEYALNNLIKYKNGLFQQLFI